MNWVVYTMSTIRARGTVAVLYGVRWGRRQMLGGAEGAQNFSCYVKLRVRRTGEYAFGVQVREGN
jgi:hypothetical protein